jgi:hypothetical protein
MKQTSLDTVCTTDWFIWFLVTSPSVFFEPYFNHVYQDVVTPPAESRIFSTFDPWSMAPLFFSQHLGHEKSIQMGMPVHSIWTNTCSHCCCFLVSVNPSSLVALTFFCDHTDMIWIKMEDPGYHVKRGRFGQTWVFQKMEIPQVSPRVSMSTWISTWWLGLSHDFP